jgi:hypothetical protein
MTIRSNLSRGLVSLGLLTTLVGLPAAVEPPAFAAEARDPRDPDARLQFIIKSIQLTSQYDVFTEGDFEFDLTFSQVIPGCADLLNQTSTCYFLAGAPKFKFGGDKNDIIQVNKYLPDLDGGGYAAKPDITAETGIPVWANKSYRLELSGTEIDMGTLEDDDAGTLLWELNAANGWDLGARTERAVTHSSYYGTGGIKTVGTLVEYEIRRMPLPDLQIRNIEVSETPGLATSHRVCTVAKNAGLSDSAAFQVVFRVDGQEIPDGVASAPQGVTVGGSADLCVNAQLRGSGQHKVSATVDEARVIAEMNELDNWIEETYTVAAPPATPTPTVPKQPDLSVTSVKVAGIEIAPQQYCAPGRNDISVAVKNGGSQPAGGSVVRLEVDDDDSDDKRVQSIDGGKSFEVTFEDVKLKEKEHSLRVTADAKDSVDEANEDNNTKTIWVTCKEK